MKRQSEKLITLKAVTTTSKPIAGENKQSECSQNPSDWRCISIRSCKGLISQCTTRYITARDYAPADCLSDRQIKDRLIFSVDKAWGTGGIICGKCENISLEERFTTADQNYECICPLAHPFYF